MLGEADETARRLRSALFQSARLAPLTFLIAGCRGSGSRSRSTGGTAGALRVWGRVHRSPSRASPQPCRDVNAIGDLVSFARLSLWASAVGRLAGTAEVGVAERALREAKTHDGIALEYAGYGSARDCCWISARYLHLTFAQLLSVRGDNDRARRERSLNSLSAHAKLERLFYELCSHGGVVDRLV